jgi:hypothetical protein
MPGLRSHFISKIQKIFKIFLNILITLKMDINPLTPELNPSAQRCLARFFTGDFAS